MNFFKAALLLLAILGVVTSTTYYEEDSKYQNKFYDAGLAVYLRK